MREEEGGLCSDVPPAAQPPEGNDPPQPQEDLPPIEDTLVYVPREVEIPLGKDGLQENGAPITSQPITTWMTAEKSTTPKYGRKMENATPVVSSDTSAGIVPKSRGPGRPKHGRAFRSKESISRPSSTLQRRQRKKKQPNNDPQKVPALP